MNKSFTLAGHENHHMKTHAMNTIGHMLKTFVDGVVMARKMQRDYETLSGMSNHELEDIGISRSDIDAVVTGTYSGARPARSNAFSSSVNSRVVCRAAWGPNGVKTAGSSVHRNSKE